MDKTQQLLGQDFVFRPTPTEEIDKDKQIRYPILIVREATFHTVCCGVSPYLDEMVLTLVGEIRKNPHLRGASLLSLVELGPDNGGEVFHDLALEPQTPLRVFACRYPTGTARLDQAFELVRSFLARQKPMPHSLVVWVISEETLAQIQRLNGGQERPNVQNVYIAVGKEKKTSMGVWSVTFSLGTDEEFQVESQRISQEILNLYLKNAFSTPIDGIL